MIDKIKTHKFIILYGIFGVLTTVINIGVYAFFYNTLNFSNVLSTIIAWVLSVLFAFITNKIWVFESKSFSLKLFVSQLINFMLCRLGTGIFELIVMFIGVDILLGPAMILKIIVNIVVIILNYVLSKILVFKKKS